MIALRETIPPPSDVNKDFTFKAKDKAKDHTFKAKEKDKDKDEAFKDKNKDWANLEFEDWTKDYGTR